MGLENEECYGGIDWETENVKKASDAFLHKNY
jgi:hypothetical protein